MKKKKKKKNYKSVKVNNFWSKNYTKSNGEIT